MGPRLVSRGNVDELDHADSRIKRLQWGRGLLAAEISRSDRTTCYRHALQWGRGLLAAEIDGYRLDSVADHASMGPRLVSRGNRVSISLTDHR